MNESIVKLHTGISTRARRNEETIKIYRVRKKRVMGNTDGIKKMLDCGDGAVLIITGLQDYVE